MAKPKSYEVVGAFGKKTGQKVYYFGKRPGFLPDGGRGFAGLKHMMELLGKSFKKYQVIFMPDTAKSSVEKIGSIYKIKLPQKVIKAFSQRRWNENRELNLRMMDGLLTNEFPDHFKGGLPLHVFKKGMFASLLKGDFDRRLLSPEDEKALTQFVTKTLTAGVGKGIDIESAYKTKQDVQLIYLKKLIADFEEMLSKGHDESTWQEYFSKNILFFQESYIRRLEKLNVTVVGTRFPDFSVVTSDSYLDILEIKKPSTELLKEDAARHNYYWSAEIAKAISQVENYIDAVTAHKDAIRSALRDTFRIDLRIIKPRGIVIAGTLSQFGSETKQADDFRRLNEGLKNVQIIPYDELSQRLKNTVASIERLSALRKKRK